MSAETTEKNRGTADFTKARSRYRSDRWRWVQDFITAERILNDRIGAEDLSKEQLHATYGLAGKWPKTMPCSKKCTNNPVCLQDVRAVNTYKGKSRPTEQPREAGRPVGLQNTANTCWINSAIQALFHLPKFRNVINEVKGFRSEHDFSQLIYLLQALFIEIDISCTKALPCSPGSVFERLGLFATQEIMKKDTDSEVLKCVSEFLENTIDTLMIDPRIGPNLTPLFNLTLTRVARWQCPVCLTLHQQEMSPAHIYTMAAYVNCEECPLEKCLLDLQAETQTGVTLICPTAPYGAGCGSTVTTERIVTPKIHTLPQFLIIRNNSLMDKELKRRMHVVFPETLDLQSHTLKHEHATYTLSAVIFHHGHWAKHYTAHVCTSAKKWYNFNDEFVSELNNKNPSGPSTPETHKNYFSSTAIALKYKNRPKTRVSRGAFIWMYVREDPMAQPPNPSNDDVVITKKGTIKSPPNEVIDYVLRKQMERQTVNIEKVEEWKRERKKLLDQLAVTTPNRPMSVIGETVLTAWISSDLSHFTVPHDLLINLVCKHNKFSPLNAHLLKFVDTAKLNSLMSSPLGIHKENSSLPIALPLDTAMCGTCTALYGSHMLFMEKLKILHKNSKRDSKKPHMGDTLPIGFSSLEDWPNYALTIYHKENNLGMINSSEENFRTNTDKECFRDYLNGCETSTNKDLTDFGVYSGHGTNGSSYSSNKHIDPKQGTSTEHKEDINGNNSSQEGQLFNEEIVCPHNQLNPSAVIYHLPEDTMLEIRALCQDMVHPATLVEDFDTCAQCVASLNASMEVCNSGKQQKRDLMALYNERRRPHPTKDAGTPVFLLSREFLLEWKSYIRSCEKNEAIISPPERISNDDLLCKHNNLVLPVDSEDSQAVVLWEDEWEKLNSLYSVDHIIHGNYNNEGNLDTVPGLCDHGCMEQKIADNYEEQFTYENQVIYVKQVHSIADIPLRDSSGRLTERQPDIPKKRPRLAGMRNNKLIRASNNFSSTSTLRDVQNFIASKTGIWPMLQEVWMPPSEDGEDVEPRQLTDDDGPSTLGTLRIKPGDTVYFRASVEDMHRAAGDGVTEYNEFDEFRVTV